MPGTIKNILWPAWPHISAVRTRVRRDRELTLPGCLPTARAGLVKLVKRVNHAAGTCSRRSCVRGGDGKTAFSPVRAFIFASVECLGLYFNRTHHTQNLLLKNNEPEISVRKSETHTQPAARSNRSTVRSSQQETSPWHPHHVSLPPSILPWLSGTLFRTV